MGSTPVEPRRSRRSRRELGFSLLELLVAILLIDVAVLGIVRTHAVVVRSRNAMRARSAATTAASARLEQLLASPCTAASGSALRPAAVEFWSSQLDGHGREISDSVVFGGAASHVVVLRTRVPC